MKCKKCGKENKREAKYCAGCGVKIEEDVDKQRTKSIYAKKKTSGKVFIFVFLVVLAIGLLLLVGIGKIRVQQYMKYIAEAERYVEEENYEMAEKCYFSALQYTSEKSGIYQKLSDIYLCMSRDAKENSDTEDAIKFCNKAIEADTENGEAYLLLGDFYQETDNLSGARDQYEKVLEIEPDSVNAYVGLLRVCVQNEEYETADKMIHSIGSDTISENMLYKKYKWNYDNFRRYSAYEKMMSEEYNKESGITHKGQWTQNYGLCFSKLVDFDGDGKEEILIVNTLKEYTSDTLPGYIEDYILDVWTYEDGKVKKVFTTVPFVSDGSQIVSLAKLDGKWFIKTGTEENASYYAFADGKFTLSSSVQFEIFEEYLLQGGDSEAEGYTYGFDEHISTINELSYKKRSSYNAIGQVPAAVWTENPAIEFGSYAYRSRDVEMYACSYRDDTEGGKTVLLIFYSEKGSGASVELFEWSNEDGYISNTGCSLSYEQTEENLSIYIKKPNGGGVIQKELQREKEYDI